MSTVRVSLILAFIFLLSSGRAQQFYQTSHQAVNQQLFLPSSIGLNNELEVFTAYRNQWTGLTDRALDNFAFAAKYPLYKFNSQVGIHLLNDRIGLMRSTYLALDYAYMIKVKKSRISLGMSVALLQSQLQSSLLRVPDGNYAFLIPEHNDELLLNTDVSGLAPDINFSISYAIGGLQASIGVNQLIGSSITKKDGLSVTSLNFARTLVAYTSYEIPVGDKIELMPNFLLKTDMVNVQTDLQLLLTYNERLHAGLGYRGHNNTSNDAVNVLVGFQFLRNAGAFYTYDITTSSLNDFSNGSHELSLRYRMPVGDRTIKRGKIIYNPRFL